MRRLLFLAALLFMSPIASGTIISLNDTGTSIEVSVFEFGEPEMHKGIAVVIEAPGVLSNFVDGPEAPTAWEMHPVTINGDSGKMWDVLFGPQDGVWVIADWSASIPVWVSAYEGSGPPHVKQWVLLDQIQVPEPMTIALLGIGGLFLLRRRR